MVITGWCNNKNDGKVSLSSTMFMIVREKQKSLTKSPFLVALPLLLRGFNRYGAGYLIQPNLQWITETSIDVLNMSSRIVCAKQDRNGNIYTH